MGDVIKMRSPIPARRSAKLHLTTTAKVDDNTRKAWESLFTQALQVFADELL